MKNASTYLFILLICIFSCNTEAKFGFRKKVKVENHTTAQIITKPHVAKHEIKINNIDTCEIITASVDENKIILPHTTLYKTTISKKKIFKDSTNRNDQNDAPILEKKLNIPAVLGFIFDYAILILPTISSLNKQNLMAIVIPLLFIIAFVLSLIGYFQIKRKKDTYWGLGFAYFGIFFVLAAFLLLLLLWIFLYFILKGTP